MKIGIVTILAIATSASLALAACAGTDVVGAVAKTSFGKVLDSSKERIFKSGDGGAWNLGSTSGDLVSFATDFARNNVAQGPDMSRPDAAFTFDARPFLAAGLDPEKLPKTGDIVYAVSADKHLQISFELGVEGFGADASNSLGATFAELVRTQRARVGYHEKLDHYGIKLGNGNMFEWAKDMSKNDKDIVWVLNPEPFIKAGLDPTKVEGWAFAKVELKDDSGKTVFLDKLLRPYNLL